MSDLMMLQCLAERAVPPGAAPKAPKSGEKMAVFGVYFEHLYTSVNGVANRGATRRSGLDPGARDWAAEIVAESVTFCDIV